MVDGNGVTTGTPAEVLTNEQKARGQALVIARDVLAQKGGGPFASVSLSSASAYDVINMAEYILVGQGYLGDGDDESVGETAESEDREPPQLGDAWAVEFVDGTRHIYLFDGVEFVSPASQAPIASDGGWFESRHKPDSPHITKMIRVAAYSEWGRDGDEGAW